MSFVVKVTKYDQSILIETFDTEENRWDAIDLPWEFLGELIQKLQNLQTLHGTNYEQLSFFNPNDI